MAVSRKGADTVDFKGLTQECLRNLEALDVVVDEFHRLRDAVASVPLPRPLALHLVLASARLLRTVTNLHAPIFELTRLVQLYSQTWEEKGAVLGKLHQSYATHHAQLQAALTQLQMTGADVERMKEDRLCMLWERLFAKSMTNQRHGRRWKFLIESFRQMAEKGEHMSFADTDAESSDDDDDDNDTADGLHSAGTGRKKPPLKATSRRATRPNILVAAERRQAERERLQQEISQLKDQITTLEAEKDQMQKRLDRVLTKKPTATMAVQVQLLKDNDGNGKNEVFKAVSKAISQNGQRMSGDTSGDATQELPTTYLFLINISGFAGVLVPDVSVEVNLKLSPTSNTKDATTYRIPIVEYFENTLPLAASLELNGMLTDDVLEVRLLSGTDTTSLMAVGYVAASVVGLHQYDSNKACQNQIRYDDKNNNCLCHHLRSSQDHGGNGHLCQGGRPRILPIDAEPCPCFVFCYICRGSNCFYAWTTTHRTPAASAPKQSQAAVR
eukprot:m.169887 g.169887  ORF g.169887 m.169887 type:complete len:500 (+) comp16481_c0_seq3:109-1608(+)